MGGRAFLRDEQRHPTRVSIHPSLSSEGMTTSGNRTRPRPHKGPVRGHYTKVVTPVFPDCVALTHPRAGGFNGTTPCVRFVVPIGQRIPSAFREGGSVPLHASARPCPWEGVALFAWPDLLPHKSGHSSTPLPGRTVVLANSTWLRHAEPKRVYLVQVSTHPSLFGEGMTAGGNRTHISVPSGRPG